MGPTDAFKKLGYELNLPRSDWSAISKHGVCVALWSGECKVRNGTSAIDTQKDCDPIKNWGHKRGNKLRISHLKQACLEFDGAIDVVIRDGKSHKNNGKADPWDQMKRGMGWQVDWLDPETGHFRASASRKCPAIS